MNLDIDILPDRAGRSTSHGQMALSRLILVEDRRKLKTSNLILTVF
jgi:hypothetical protein